MGLYSDFGNMLTPQKAAAIQTILKKNACLDVVLALKRYQGLEKINSKHLVKWGYEVEGHFLKMSEKKQLQFCFQSFQQEKDRTPFPMLPEYGSWMFQILPMEAFTNSTDLVKIVTQLKNIYQYFQKSGKMILTIPNIPFLGANSEKNQNNQFTKSLYIDDRHVVNHARLRTMTKNIMTRRMSKMQVNAPLFIDEKTDKLQISETQPDPKFIFMDANAFGPGMACLQCTFSTENLYNTQFIHDNMHIISPLMLAITAGTPFFKGKVSDWDVRWKVLEETSDCRNNQEKDKNNKLYTPNSRYSPSRFFISSSKFNKKQYNNMEARVDPQLKELIKSVSDEKQLKIQDPFLDHLANIVSRDLLFVTQDIKKMIGENQTLFDTFNCSNMPSVRLKFPIGNNLGWRAELRTMQVQLTAEQNAAFCLLTYFFNYYILENQNKINLYLPMSFVHQNFERALTNDAVRRQKFFFRTNIFSNGDAFVQQLNLSQIFFGYDKEGKKFIGIFNLVKEFFINSTEDDDKFKKIVEEVFKFLEEKISGQRLTLAQWMRGYVKKHSDYKSNSILTKKTMDDLLKKLYQISNGIQKEKNFQPIFSL